MKKLLSILLALSLIFGLCVGMAGSVSAEDYYGDGYYAWDNGDGTCQISYYENPDTVEITVPQYVDGMRVTGLIDGCFTRLSNLEKVTIPEGVCSIGSRVFDDCWQLHSIYLPASLTELEDDTLLGSSLKEVQVDAGNKTFSAVDGVLFSKDKHTLLYYPAKKEEESYRVPDGVTEIANYAFSDNLYFSSVTFPETLTTIGILTFAGCNLKKLTLPDSVTECEMGAFSNCQHLRNVTLSKNLTSISRLMFDNCDLRSVTIPDKVTWIDEYAFSGCEKLSSVNISESVVFIGEAAFLDCGRDVSLSFTLPKNVSCLGDIALASATSISVDADSPYFASENGVLFSKDMTKLIQYPSKCAANSYDIPSSVTEIGNRAFYHAYYLQSVSIPDSVTSLCQGAFTNCGLTSVTIPQGIREIPETAFSGCEQLANVAFPDKLEMIDSGAFEDCYSLKSISLPPMLTYLGNFAFFKCESLDWVYLPESISYLGYSLFDLCENLKSIFYEGSYSQWQAIENSEYASYGYGCNATVYYDCNPVVGSFMDVKATDWFKNAVAYAYENELMNGTSDMLFNPSGSLTRGQLITILYRVAGEPAVEAPADFSDVPAGKYFSNAVAWAAENGIVNGYNDGSFKPDNKITREQIATILYRYAGNPKVDGPLDYPDAEKIGNYAKDAMTWAVSEGLITGIKSNGVTTLAPKNTATRAQIATIIMRFLMAE